MEAELVNIIVTAVSGPAAAVVVCLLVMWRGYKLIVEKMLPAQAQLQVSFYASREPVVVMSPSLVPSLMVHQSY